MNILMLKGRMIEKQVNAAALAAKIGIDRATLYRKMKKNSFTVAEAKKIKEALSLTVEESMALFFN